MPPILRAILASLLVAAMAWAGDAHARSARASIERVESPVGRLDGVRLRLDWPEGATVGTLQLHAARLSAPALGYRFERIEWRCTLRRDGWSNWRCAGPVRTPQGAMELEIDIREKGLDATLERGASRIAVSRRADAPDLTRIDLAAIPLAWTRALLAQAWPEAQLKGGEGDARLQLTAGRDALRIAGPLALRDISLDTPDGRIAAEGVDVSTALDMRLGDADRVQLRGTLGGGEILVGTTYLALQGRRVDVELDAGLQGACCWRVPRFEWRDGGTVHATGSLAFGPDTTVRELAVDIHRADLPAMRDAYLSGWLGAAGLGDVALRGAIGGRVAMREGALHAVDVDFQGVGASDAKGRFAFESVDGGFGFSAGAPVRSELRVGGGHVYGLAFGAARIPMLSDGGRLALPSAVELPMLGGRLRFEHVAIRPAAGGNPAEAAFGLDVQGIDVARLSESLGWPAFTGELSGRIPNARYRGDALVFDGGLSMQLFGGRVDVSSLAMERPFGVAPTLGADIAIDDLDLESLTGVLGFGEITGTLDGRIAGLRLVDWQAEAFDARLQTDRKRGVRQRISQRAVQDLSSVGDASFVSTLQSRLIGVFDDFGYSRIGIACRLVDTICEMGGLGPRGDDAFLIVAGSGIPRLTVVGIKRRVDWPTLVERLVAVGSGDTKPVFE